MFALARPLTLGLALLASLGVPALAAPAQPAAATRAAPDRCHTGRLVVNLVPGSGDAGVGHVGFTFRVTSLAQQPCTLFGYPGALLLGADGREIRTTLQWGSGYLFGNLPRQLVTLKTGAAAYFKLEWVHIPSTGQSCPDAAYLLVTPPDERTPIAVPAQMLRVCGGKLVATPLLATA